MHIYLITDNRSRHQLLPLLSPLLDHGLKKIQLRNKRSSLDEIQRNVDHILPVILSYQAELIINDHVSVAHQFGLGVHLGLSDGDPVAARALLGQQATIGITVHDDLERIHQYKDIASYVGVGPVFPTKTKLDTQKVIGTQRLAEVVEESSLPVVAIGGINTTNYRRLQKPLPKHIAVCSAICSADNPLRAFLGLTSK